mgnify:CR=1 FL=1
MNDNVLYEMIVEKSHLNLIKQSLSLQINNLYEAVDAEVVNTNKAHEDIKVLSDMLAVLKGQSSYKQTSESVGLMWMREIDLDEQEFKQHNDNLLQKQDDQRNQELNDYAEYAESCLENFLKNHHKEDSINPSKAWNNVKERHWDTIKRMGDK